MKLDLNSFADPQLGTTTGGAAAGKTGVFQASPPPPLNLKPTPTQQQMVNNLLLDPESLQQLHRQQLQLQQLAAAAGMDAKAAAAAAAAVGQMNRGRNEPAGSASGMPHLPNPMAPMMDVKRLLMQQQQQQHPQLPASGSENRPPLPHSQSSPFFPPLHPALASLAAVSSSVGVPHHPAFSMSSAMSSLASIVAASAAGGLSHTTPPAFASSSSRSSSPSSQLNKLSSSGHAMSKPHASETRQLPAGGAGGGESSLAVGSPLSQPHHQLFRPHQGMLPPFAMRQPDRPGEAPPKLPQHSILQSTPSTAGNMPGRPGQRPVTSTVASGISASVGSPASSHQPNSPKSYPPSPLHASSQPMPLVSSSSSSSQKPNAAPSRAATASSLNGSSGTAATAKDWQRVPPVHGGPVAAQSTVVTSSPVVRTQLPPTSMSRSPRPEPGGSGYQGAGGSQPPHDSSATSASGQTSTAKEADNDLSTSAISSADDEAEDGKLKEAGTMTDNLLPAKPGTKVNLEGLVLQETPGGLLVVNVMYRGREFSGTLLDCTEPRNMWAGPRHSEIPPPDKKPKRKGRGKADSDIELSSVSSLRSRRKEVEKKNPKKGKRGRKRRRTDEEDYDTNCREN